MVNLVMGITGRLCVCGGTRPAAHSLRCGQGQAVGNAVGEFL